MSVLREECALMERFWLEMALFLALILLFELFGSKVARHLSNAIMFIIFDQVFLSKLYFFYLSNLVDFIRTWWASNLLRFHVFFAMQLVEHVFVLFSDLAIAFSQGVLRNVLVFVEAVVAAVAFCRIPAHVDHIFLSVYFLNLIDGIIMALSSRSRLILVFVLI